MKQRCAQEGCLWKPKYEDPLTGQQWCGVHARTRQMADQTVVGRMTQTLQAAGTQVDITEDPDVQRVQAALVKHQETCLQCAAEREWTVTEMAAGRVTSQADVERVGKHALDNCCSYGARLRSALGLAMLGRPTTLPDPDS